MPKTFRGEDEEDKGRERGQRVQQRSDSVDSDFGTAVPGPGGGGGVDDWDSDDERMAATNGRVG